MSPTDIREKLCTGAQARQAIRAGQWRRPTAGLAPGYVQANLVILPQDYAYDFLRFCVFNPKACPLLDITEPGSPYPGLSWAADTDLRTDLPAYRLYRAGKLEAEPENLMDLWQPDFVSFLIGCSFTFEQALLAEGVPVRHIECGCNVPMYRTTLSCRPAGPFHGNMVVSMRPIPGSMVAAAVKITSRYPGVHGSPVHIGSPETIGIRDIMQPDYGDPVQIHPDELPVFWACGVTPQAVALAAKIPMMITHSPGHMLITDRLNIDLASS